MRALILVLLLSACSSVETRYAPIPAGLIPVKPELENIKSEELQCLTEEAYTKLVKNMQKLQNYSSDLRALLSN